jgi:hypothetical protein
MKRILLWVLALCVLASPGCGGGGARRSINNPGLSPVAPQAPSENPDRNVLTAVTPPLAGLGAGSEFEFTLSAQLAEELKQGCGRLIYDSAVVVPVAVEKGGLIPTSFVFFSKLDAPGVVPFAFTSLPDGRGIAPGRGELLRVRFRMLADPPSGFRVRLQNDGAFLQLRSAQGGRMSFDLASEVQAQ